MSSFSIKSSHPFISAGKQEQKVDSKSYFDSSKINPTTSSTSSTYGSVSATAPITSVPNKTVAPTGFSIKHNIYSQEDFY